MEPVVEPMVDESSSFFSSLFQLIDFHNVAIVLIVVSFVIAIAVIIERILRLKEYNVNGASFMHEVQKYILSNDLDGAIRLCNGSPTAALPKVIKSGLQRASRDEQQIQNAIDASSLEVLPKLERRLNYLSVIANIATLLGLLGTIAGLIKAFNAIGLADPAQRQKVLSIGISNAMEATALGLLTAIIAMIAHSWLATRAQKITEDIDEFGVKLMDLLSARKYRHSSEKVME